MKSKGSKCRVGVLNLLISPLFKRLFLFFFKQIEKGCV
jgi:hypothetical protein